MGICLSCRSPHLPTAKLVVIEEEADGLIREFPEHVKVAEILRDRPGFVVCHADSIDYHEYVSPLSAEQELQVEHLYFLLPVTRLRRPLTATDRAALAVEARAAKGCSRHREVKLGRRSRRKITPSVTVMGQEVTAINHLGRRRTGHLITSSRQSKGEGYNSETLEWKRVGFGLRGGPARSKMQLTASGRQRANTASFNGPWKMKLPTIYEEGFHSLIAIT